MSGRRRVLVAKPGLDGHDRGAHVVARGLRDAGVEVVYTGLRQTPAQIARAAVEEDVAVVGLSILAGGHLGLARKVRDQLDAAGAQDIELVVGGVIPAEDIPELLSRGVAAVYPSSTPLSEVVEGIETLLGSNVST